MNYVIKVEVTIEYCDYEYCNYQSDYQLFLISGFTQHFHELLHLIGCLSVTLTGIFEVALLEEIVKLMPVGIS